MAQIQETFLFQPTQVSGCQLWLDAADASTLTLSGTSVTAWADKSGRANNPTISVNRPTYVASSRSVETFNLNQSFTAPATIFNTTAGSLFMAFADKQQNSANAVVFGLAAGYVTSNFYSQSGRRSDGFSYAFTGVNVIPTGFSNAMNTTSNLLYVQNYIYNSSNLSVGVNGTSYNVTSIFGNQVVTPSGSLEFSGTSWGGYLNAKFYEILFYNSVLTTANIQQVEGYLAWKWGLQGSLPANHPYKTYRPLAQTPFPTAISPMPIVNQNISVFTPTQVSGCQLWLDAADATTFTVSGSNISLWRDKSGSNNNATQSTSSNQPFFTQYLNQNTVFFNAGQALLTNVTSQPVAESVVVLYNRPFVDNLNANTTIVGTTKSQGRDIFAFSDTATPTLSVQYDAYERAAGAISSNLTYGVPHFFVATYSGTTSSVFTDGGSNPSVSLTFSGGGTTMIGASYLNGIAPNLFAPLKGYIYEIIIYNNAISTSSRQQVEGYLAWKWGLTANLPNGHPYKRPPLAPFPSRSVAFNGSVSQWLPTQISGLRLWMDATDVNGTGVNPSSATITTWKDKSSSGLSLTSSTARTLNKSSLNGKAGVTFPNTDSGGGFRATITNSVTSPPLLIVAVCSYVTSANDVNMLISCTGNDMNVCKFKELPNNWLQAYNTGGLIRSPNQMTTGAQLISVIYDNLLGGIWKNGFNEVLASGGTSTQFSGTVGVATYAANNSGIWSGDINEILVYPSNSTFQRQQVEGYLAWKWGLQGSLPGNHPYKFFPPSP